MHGTTRNDRVIYGTNRVYSCHWGFYFFIYYRGGMVVEVPVEFFRRVLGRPPLVP